MLGKPFVHTHGHSLVLQTQNLNEIVYNTNSVTLKVNNIIMMNSYRKFNYFKFYKYLIDKHQNGKFHFHLIVWLKKWCMILSIWNEESGYRLRRFILIVMLQFFKNCSKVKWSTFMLIYLNLRRFMSFLNVIFYVWLFLFPEI